MEPASSPPEGSSPEPASPCSSADPLPSFSDPLMVPAEDSSPEPPFPQPLPSVFPPAALQVHLPLPEPVQSSSPELPSPQGIAMEMGPGGTVSHPPGGEPRILVQKASGGLPPQTGYGGVTRLTTDNSLIHSMQQKIDSLSATIDRMRAQFADTIVIKESLVATKDEVTALRRQVLDVEQKTVGLGSSVGYTRNSISEFGESLFDARQRLSGLDYRVPALETNPTALELPLAAVQTKPMMVESPSISDLQKLSDRLDSSLGAVRDQLRDHATTTHDHITRLNNDVSTIKVQIVDMGFDTHKDSLSSAQKTIARLETTTNENQAGLTSLNKLSQGRLTDLERRVTGTQEELTRTNQSVQDTHTEVRAAQLTIAELEVRMSQADREVSNLQQASNNTQQKVAVIEQSLDKTREDLPRIIESTFRDSQDIQSTMESRVEKQCTTIVTSTLESSITPRILVVETKADIVEKQLDSVQQDGATKKEAISTPASLISTIRAELEKATRDLGDKVQEIEVKLDNLEASLPELQHTITITITNTVRESKEIHETIESIIYRSEAIREVITKTASLSDQMASVSTLRADLRDLNTLTEDMRNRVIRLEEMLVTGDTPSDHSDAGGERLTVPEDRLQARATLVVQLQTRVTRVERRIAQIIGESTKTRRDLDMVQQIAVGLRAARGRS